MILRKLVSLFCFVGVVCILGCQNDTIHKETRTLMGTFIEVSSPDRRAASIVFDEISRIDGLLNRYNKNSEIYKLNATGKLKASPDTFYIIRSAKEFWLLSDGAFDITVGPLVDAWGFPDKKYRIPNSDEIDAAVKLIGFDKIVFNDGLSTIELKEPGMKIDLGIIAKGYAVDCAVKRLKERGINSCLINAGGDIYCLGDKFGKPWVVGVQDPRGDDLVNYLELRNRAVATIASNQNGFIKDNKHYSQIINPKKGYPADSGVISVTVVADDCLRADSLAATIFVLGKKKGMELSKKITGVDIEVIEEGDIPINQ